MQNHKCSTAKQISKSLEDISVPTLYRHINDLLDEQVLIIVEERKVRGSIERTLAINEDKITDVTNHNISDSAYQFLMGLYSQFQNYSLKEAVDPVEDMLSLRTSYLYLSDEEFSEFLQDISHVIAKYQQYSLKEERKARSISFVSAPAKEIDGNEEIN